MRRLWIASFGLAAAAVGAAFSPAACATLNDIPENVCGNLIIEPTNGEDCDGRPIGADGGPSDQGFSCSQCRVQCKSSVSLCAREADAGDAGGALDAGTLCPDGWGCGTDGICRRPSSTFLDPVVKLDETAEHLALGDIDGSGRKAIVVDTGAELNVHYLDDTGALSLTQSFTVPSASPAVGDFNGDGIADVAYALAEAVTVRQGACDQSLTAIPFAAPVPAEYQVGPKDRLIPISAGEIDTTKFQLKELLRLSQDTVTTFFPDATGMLNHPVTLAMVGYGNLPTPDANVPVGFFKESAPCSQFVITNAMAHRLEVYDTCQPLTASTAQWNTLATHQPVMVTVPGIRPLGPAFRADVNLDGHLDLVVFDADMTDNLGLQGEIQVAYGDGKGNFNSTPGGTDGSTGPYVCYTGLLSLTEMCSMVPLAVGVLDTKAQYPVLDFVTACGVFHPSFSTTPSFAPSCSTQMLLSQPFATMSGVSGAPWTTARIADINGDQAPDVVAASCAASSITYLENAASNVFNEFTIPTVSGIDDLVVGDFDGDLVNDIGYLERSGDAMPCTPTAPDHPPQSSLGVVFGATAGGPSSAVVVASGLNTVNQLAATSLTNTVGEFSTVTTLVTLQTSSDGTYNLLEIFQGSTNREIVAPYYLVSADLTGHYTASYPWLLSIGHFGAGAPAGLAVLARDSVTGKANAWALTLSNGTFSNGQPTIVSDVGMPAQYAMHKGSWGEWIAPVNLGGNDGDEMISLTRTDATSKVDVLAANNGVFTLAGGTTGTPLPTNYDGPIVVGDIDLDGTPDLVVNIDSDVLVVWNKGSATMDIAGATHISAADLTGTPCGAPGTIVATALIHAAPSLAPQVFILAQNHAYLASPDPAAPASHRFTFSCVAGIPGAGVNAPLMSGTIPATLVATGDVDGDGVDDVVIANPGSVEVYRGKAVIP